MRKFTIAFGSQMANIRVLIYTLTQEIKYGEYFWDRERNN